MFRLSIEQLTAFVAVAECGSYSKAARLIGKNRSTLHHQITDLEIDVGFQLFEKTGRKPTLTFSGKTLFPKAQHIVKQLDSFERVCEDLGDNGVPEITICYNDILRVEDIEKIDNLMVNRFPYTKLNWLHKNREESIQLISNGNGSMAITMNNGGVSAESGMAFKNLGYPEYAFYAHRSSGLIEENESRKLTSSDLEANEQVMLESFLQSAYSIQAKLSPNCKIVSSMDLLLMLLKKSGFALLPCHIMDEYEEFKRLDLDFMLRTGRIGYTLLMLPGGDVTPPQKAIIDILCHHFDSIN